AAPADPWPGPRSAPASYIVRSPSEALHSPSTNPPVRWGTCAQPSCSAADCGRQPISCARPQHASKPPAHKRPTSAPRLVDLPGRHESRIVGRPARPCLDGAGRAPQQAAILAIDFEGRVAVGQLHKVGAGGAVLVNEMDAGRVVQRHVESY